MFARVKTRIRTRVFRGLAVVCIALVAVEPSGMARGAEDEAAPQSHESPARTDEGIPAALASALDEAKAAGVTFIRNELFPRSDDGGKSQNYVNAAKRRGIRVIGILRSKDCCQPYLSIPYPCGWRQTCFLDFWGTKWQDFVRTVVRENRHWVVDWQIDNELNHPLQNIFAAANTDLRKKIVRLGVEAALDADHNLRTTMVNLYYGDFFANERDIGVYRDLRDSGVRIDLLGLDIYRATYSGGSASQYGDDFTRAHEIWRGDMLMSETGFCTAAAPYHLLPTLTKEGQMNYWKKAQTNYVAETYATLNAFQHQNAWYKGTLSYVASDEPQAVTSCEAAFGLLGSNGVSEKPAWSAFSAGTRACTGASTSATTRFCGLTAHFPAATTSLLPTIGFLSPSTAVAGQAGLLLTVRGVNFTASSVVHWNGQARVTTFVSSTQLQARVAPADLAAAGTAQVTVVSPAPGGGTSVASTFTISRPQPTPGPILLATATPTRPTPMPTRTAIRTIPPQPPLATRAIGTGGRSPGATVPPTPRRGPRAQ